jgi:hypothetical protein
MGSALCTADVELGVIVSRNCSHFHFRRGNDTGVDATNSWFCLRNAEYDFQEIWPDLNAQFT